MHRLGFETAPARFEDARARFEDARAQFEDARARFEDAPARFEGSGSRLRPSIFRRRVDFLNRSRSEPDFVFVERIEHAEAVAPCWGERPCPPGPLGLPACALR